MSENSATVTPYQDARPHRQDLASHTALETIHSIAGEPTVKFGSPPELSPPTASRNTDGATSFTVARTATSRRIGFGTRQ
jgi:hypothetical protein